jgi:hypothetical protein
VLDRINPLAVAWHAGASGSERFVAVTAVSQVLIKALPGSGQAASSLAATDYSQDTEHAGPAVAGRDAPSDCRTWR